MDKPIRILHIDSAYQAHYITLQTGLFIHSRISLKEAVSFLKTTDFHLILSEPQGKAIISQQFPRPEKIPPLADKGQKTRTQGKTSRERIR